MQRQESQLLLQASLRPDYKSLPTEQEPKGELKNDYCFPFRGTAKIPLPCGGIVGFSKAHIHGRSWGSTYQYHWSAPFFNCGIAPSVCLNNIFDACCLHKNSPCVVNVQDS